VFGAVITPVDVELLTVGAPRAIVALGGAVARNPPIFAFCHSFPSVLVLNTAPGPIGSRFQHRERLFLPDEELMVDIGAFQGTRSSCDL